MTTTIKSRSHESDSGGVSNARVAEPPSSGPVHNALNAFIGKRITEGHASASAGAPSFKIFASDAGIQGQTSNYRIQLKNEMRKPERETCGNVQVVIALRCRN